MALLLVDVFNLGVFGCCFVICFADLAASYDGLVSTLSYGAVYWLLAVAFQHQLGKVAIETFLRLIHILILFFDLLG